MADEYGERTQHASPKRRQDAKREGRIPRSPELATAAALLGSALVLSYAGAGLARLLASTFTRTLGAVGTHADDVSGLLGFTRGVLAETLLGVLLFLCGLAAFPVALAALQARGVLSTTPMAPKWERINPLAGLKRMLGPQAWVGLLKALVKLGIVGWALWSVGSGVLGQTLQLVQHEPYAALRVAQDNAMGLLRTAGFAYLLLAAVDYANEWWRSEKQLRMTLQEVKEESRQSDGDPMVRQRQRSMARQRLRQQMLTTVKDADVVITNPTHIAVAVKYNPETAPAPFVLAMGQRKVAEKIKQLAYSHGIPVVENKPVARALFSSATVGQMIPPDLYLAVAEILAFILRTRQDRAQAWLSE